MILWCGSRTKSVMQWMHACPRVSELPRTDVQRASHLSIVIENLENYIRPHHGFELNARCTIILYGVLSGTSYLYNSYYMLWIRAAGRICFWHPFITYTYCVYFDYFNNNNNNNRLYCTLYGSWVYGELSWMLPFFLSLFAMCFFFLHTQVRYCFIFFLSFLFTSFIQSSLGLIVSIWCGK